MVSEHKIKEIGGSKFLIVPHEFIKVYKLDNYIYLCEVSRDGKTIIYKRMRKDETSTDHAHWVRKVITSKRAKTEQKCPDLLPTHIVERRKNG